MAGARLVPYPHSIAGATAGAKFETFGLSLEQKLKTGTYIGIEGQLLNSRVERTIGAVDLNFPPAFVASGTRQNLDYDERNLIVTLNQLLGDSWSLGARYQLSKADLEIVYPAIPASVTSANHAKDEGTLHQLSLFARKGQTDALRDSCCRGLQTVAQPSRLCPNWGQSFPFPSLSKAPGVTCERFWSGFQRIPHLVAEMLLTS